MFLEFWEYDCFQKIQVLHIRVYIKFGHIFVYTSSLLVSERVEHTTFLFMDRIKIVDA